LFNSAFPSFSDFSKLISSTPIRNMATLAGNFINASPIGDLSIYFLALDARLVLIKGDEKRILPLKELYKGYKQLDRAPGENIKEIWIEVPTSTPQPLNLSTPYKGRLFNFEKVSKRTHLDIASVNSAFYVFLEGDTIQWASLSAGGVAPVPLFLKETSALLKGRKPGISLLDEAIELMQSEISPISDARGSKEYKRLLLAQLLKAHFLKLFPSMITEESLTTFPA
jgi:xanthine dehydrogenase small subunit